MLFHFQRVQFRGAVVLIFYSARNTAYVGDLHPASSNFLVCLVSFHMGMVSACSWPSHCSFVFRKFHSPLLIVHPCPSGPRHVVESPVVMILVLCTRSRQDLGSDKTTCWDCLVQEPSLSNKYVLLFAQVGGEDHLQPSAHELQTHLVDWVAD